MLVAAEDLATGHHALASGQMHAAMDASHHILSLNGKSVLLRFLPLFNPTNVGSQRPENEHSYKSEKQQPTHVCPSFPPGPSRAGADRNWSG